MAVPKSTSSLDLPSVLFEADQTMREALLSDPDFAEVQRSFVSADPPPKRLRRQLLERTSRITPRMAPGLYRLLAESAGALGLDAKQIDVFCFQDPDIKAFALPPDRRRLTLAFANGTLERLTDGELRFVIGHELGHALSNHLELNAEFIRGDQRLAPIHKMRFFAWLRYAELSADRLGMLACGDFDTAIRALFKMTSGLCDPRFLQHLPEAAAQYTVLEAETMESFEEDWFSTHPYSPLRMRALGLFSQSRRYHELTRKPSSRALLSEAQLERQVAEVIELMNPTFLHRRSPRLKEAQRFIELACQVMRGDEPIDCLDELSEPLKVGLSAVRRQKIVEDVVSVALSKDQPSDQQHDLLEEVAGRLQVDRTFVDAAIARLLRGLD